MSDIRLSVILPTFNESGNVVPMVAAVRSALEPEGIAYEIIFVDDSNDDTPDIVHRLEQEDPRITLIHRSPELRTGLATAFLWGFAQAKAPYICCMDADLQHPPAYLPHMLSILERDSATMVIASRFAPGGVDRGWRELHRQIITKTFRFVAWSIIPLSRKTTDPMTGYFMFKRSLLSEHPGLRPLGFKILLELLARIPTFKTHEIPLHFQERLSGETKASAKQAIAFVRHLVRLALSTPRSTRLLWWSMGGALVLLPVIGGLTYVATNKTLLALGTAVGAAVAALMVPALSTVLFMGAGLVAPFVSGVQALYTILMRHPRRVLLTALSTTILAYTLYTLYALAVGGLADAILTIALLQIAQGAFALYILTYAWEDPTRIDANSSPTTYDTPTRSFTALLAARNEATVIGQTIRSILAIDYPKELKELLVVLRDDDPETILAAEQALEGHSDENARIVLITGEPFNKPHHLNDGLLQATKDIVCVFDAEDEPHPSIYRIVDTVYTRTGSDVVQSGVQLMNFDSNWYSLFNCLEYFLWFRSALHFFAHHGLIPLGGNTVFFKRDWLMRVTGWDLNCLTEDADIGIRMSALGAKTSVIYDPLHATREETPPTLISFIKQRTRWNQGFLQIIHKHQWGMHSPLSLKQQCLALFVLGWPIAYSVLLILVPFVVVAAFFVDVHPVIGLITNIPTLLLFAFLILQIVALFDFARIYQLKLTARHIAVAFITYIPYLLVLEYSAFRAVVRYLRSESNWEKTEHIGAHRTAETVDSPVVATT